LRANQAGKKNPSPSPVKLSLRTREKLGAGRERGKGNREIAKGMSGITRRTALNPNRSNREGSVCLREGIAAL
jgi:hypothetical protein